MTDLAISTTLSIPGAGRTDGDAASYDAGDAAVRMFIRASLFWCVAGLAMGLWVALLLVAPTLNLGLEWTSFGRVRPIHTTLIVYAFTGNALIGSSFFVAQRTCRTALWGSRELHQLLFGCYQIFVLLAVSGYVIGATQSKEYAEFEWYTDLFLLGVWLLYATILVRTILQRRERHIYVALWFYLSFVIVVGMVHTLNNLAVPVSFTGAKSYPLLSGVQDAMVQWWFGHNIVGFFLTAGVVGMMYYFVPKQADRPVYSYRLSIVHFWSLVFIYIWAGPHHLHYTALPDWAQTLGMTFSIMLWMPSWGGMINGIMTLSGAWDKLRTDPVLRFLVTSVAFYGMSTFEGPLMAIKPVNALSHYTDWTVGHVHSGALGWVAFMVFGSLYHLVPRLWGRERLYSVALVSLHFWTASVGILLYIAAMWVSGIMQGLMWRAYDTLGFLQYSFVETVTATHPFHVIRAAGGALFLAGALMMVYNLVRTMRGDVASEPGRTSRAANLRAAAR
ncbi:cytochrome-c oxidase, cbb3-type subunit I [Azospirillum sp. YIM DDC1]|uniref:cytochrome-c oxidase n=2 Tax=Azospirillum aestuarii TaxID=2802052 RepID=A0ABS1I4R5_9PROT|nr:cytochrome-c oxidase, cbb3-type subunit I [Azospirillum aestuarii]